MFTPREESKGQSILESFEKNMAAVENLLGFDRFLLDFPISNLRKAKASMEQHVQNPYLTKDVTNSLLALESILDNGSLKKKYKPIFNQSLVLLVSYFEFALNDFVRLFVGMFLQEGMLKGGKNDALRISYGELQDLLKKTTTDLGDFILEKRQTSFQNIKNTISVVRDFFGIEDQFIASSVHNIIIGQACRHIIVHNAARVDLQMLEMIQDTDSRTIHRQFTLDELIELEPEEVRTIGKSMKEFLEELLIQCNNKLNLKNS